MLNSDLNTSVACGSSCMVLSFFSPVLDFDALLLAAAAAALAAGTDGTAAVTLSPLTPASAQEHHTMHKITNSLLYRTGCYVNVS